MTIIMTRDEIVARAQNPCLVYIDGIGWLNCDQEPVSEADVHEIMHMTWGLPR